MMNRLHDLILLAVTLLVAIPAYGQSRRVTIGMVVDGPWEGNEDIQDQMITEIRTLTEDEFNVLFPADKTRVADWTIAGVRVALQQLLADPEVDMVLAMGMMASELACRECLRRPSCIRSREKSYALSAAMAAGRCWHKH